MKKLIILLICFAIIPTIALCETDNIVGAWYYYFDFNVYPELQSNFGDYDNILCVCYFLEDGTVVELGNTMNNGQWEPQCSANGKWEKNGDFYNYNIIGLGEGTITIDNKGLHVYMPKNKLSMLLRKVFTFNPYTDYMME